MPRAFTAEETDRIRDRLKKAGKDAFARRGVRGTTVDELAWAAAISKGAFYRFFDSKESLLLALLDDYEITMQAEIVEAVRREPGRGIDVLIDSALHAIGHNPLLPVLMSEEGLRVIHSRPPAEREALLERGRPARRVGARRAAGSRDHADCLRSGPPRAAAVTGLCGAAPARHRRGPGR